MASPIINVITKRKPVRRFVRKYSHELQQLGTVFVFYLVGVLYYQHAEEDWSLADCIYFITVSITTVGYGDFAPTKDNSKVFTIFFVLFGLLVIFAIINDFALYIIHKAEENAMKKIKSNESNEDVKENHFAKIFSSVVIILLCIFGGALFFTFNEDWSFLDAFYFSFITTMTVGYGDLTLEEQSSRVFSIFYIIVSVIAVAGAIGNIGAVQVAISMEKKRNEMLTRPLDLQAIIDMDTDGGGVDRVEFLTAMLVQMNDLDKEKDIDPWLKRFDELDKDGSGALDEEDLRLFEEEEKQRKGMLKKQLNVSDDDDEDGEEDEHTNNGNDYNNPLKEKLMSTSSY